VSTVSDELQLLPAPDASGAAWLAELLGRSDRPVSHLDGSASTPAGAVVPAGFEAYARLFHPAVNSRTGRIVRWADVASQFGRQPHAEMQWHSIIGSQKLYNTHPDPFQDPRSGQLPLPETEALVDVLVDHTRTPDSCWFAVWEGRGTPVPLRAKGAESSSPRGVGAQDSGGSKWYERWPFCDAAKLDLPGRSYYLLRGPTEAAVELARWSGASLWWPDDRAWCVATEVDFMWTYVGGSNECIRRILTDHRLETWPAALTDRADAGGDWINED